MGAGVFWFKKFPRTRFAHASEGYGKSGCDAFIWSKSALASASPIAVVDLGGADAEDLGFSYFRRQTAESFAVSAWKGAITGRVLKFENK